MAKLNLFNKAVISLVPQAKFCAKRIDDDNIEITEWINTSVSQPSASQILTKMSELQTIIENEATAKANNKTSAQNKLKALGLTDAEIEAL
jgi:hypothetical protein